MNYVEQKSFARASWTIAALFVAVGSILFVAGGVASWEDVTARGIALSVLFIVAAAYGLSYLPLYLRLSVESRKRHTWSVRVRLIALVLVALATLPVGRGERGWSVWVLSVLISATAVAAVRTFVRRTRDGGDLNFAPVPLLIADVLVIAAVASRHEATALPLAAALALAGVANAVTSHGSLQTVGGLVIVALSGFVAYVTGAGTPVMLAMTIGAPASFVIGSVYVTRRADRRHEQNVEQTIDDLTAFALVSPEEASELLTTSTAILARNWNDSRPTGEREVSRWYEENSEYYLYDLSQFHLAYKHISFMCDIASLAHGRVLDFGAGVGDLALELARRGLETFYVDVDGRTKQFARWRAERDWVPLQFASDLDELEGQFDTIISLDVFEHLARPEPVIESLVARLAPGGRLIVTSAFGPTKAHPMHFDHHIDLGAFLESLGLVNAKTLRMRLLGSEFFRKPNVLVYRRPNGLSS